MTADSGAQRGTGVDRSRASLRPRGPSVELWGVLNVTPDSFSDGGQFLAPDAAIAAGLALAHQGAGVIDVGGASSRPPGATYGAGAAFVAPEAEAGRVLPVVEALVARQQTVSIDTARGLVARRALEAGARIVNDVTMGADPALLAAAAEHGAELVLMHSRGDGRADAAGTDYGAALVETVAAELGAAIEQAARAGIARDRIWIDPGIGFSKTAEQSARLVACLPALRALLPGHRVLVGASRKSFLARLAPDADGNMPPPTARLAGSLVAALVAARHGADALRVHDVGETRQALLAAAALEHLAEVPRG